MSVNSVGPGVGGSTLLASYIEKQGSNSAPQQSFVQNAVQNNVQNSGQNSIFLPAQNNIQNGVQNGVQNSSYNALKVPLQTFPAQTALPQNFPKSPAAQFPAAQSPVVQPSLLQAPVAQAPADIKEPKTDENKAQNPEGNAKTPEGKEKKPSVFSKAKELFKDPKTKKIIIAGIGALVIIAGITTFALLSRRRAEVSPELENALWDFVNTLNGFFGRG